MVVAERFPVPLEGVDAGGVTLGFVFAVSAIILLGWPAGVIIAAGGPTLTHLVSAGRRCASPTTARCSRSRRSRPGSSSSTSTATRPSALVAQVVLCGVPLLLGRQPRADQRGPRGRASGRSFLRDRAGEHHADDGAVRVHGLGGADARRALAARSPRSRSRSSARCSRSPSTSARRSRRCGRCGSP